MTTQKLVTVVLPHEFVARIDRLAKAQRISRSAFIGRVLHEHIFEAELTIKALQDPLISKAMVQAFGSPEFVRAIAASVQSDLTDGQLELFARKMEQMASGEDKPPLPLNPTRKRRSPARSGKKNSGRARPAAAASAPSRKPAKPSARRSG